MSGKVFPYVLGAMASAMLGGYTYPNIRGGSQPHPWPPDPRKQRKSNIKRKKKGGR